MASLTVHGFPPLISSSGIFHPGKVTVSQGILASGGSYALTSRPREGPVGRPWNCLRDPPRLREGCPDHCAWRRHANQDGL